MKITRHGFAVIEGDTHISKWAEQSGRLDHDQNMLPLVLPFIKPGSIVIDAGAYIGDHTRAYLNAGAVVYAFEPNPEAYECLEYNLGQEDAAILFNCGLSDKERSYSVNDGDANHGTAYLSEGGEVECITIDSLNLPRLDFIKIDVEGMELNVLKGGEISIVLHKPVMLIEINRATLERNGSSADKIFQWLTSHGYTYRNIYPGQSLNDAQFDILCQPVTPS